MGIQSPYLLPGVNSAVGATITQNPTLNQNQDTGVNPMASGRQGELLTSDVHGRSYTAGSRQNVWWGTSGTGGSKFIAPGQTTGSFMLYNPVNSGVYVEVIQFRVAGASTETDVISGLALEGSVQLPSGTLTGCTVSQMPLGVGNLGVVTASSSAKARVYGVATITAMTYLGNLGVTIQATTSPVSNGTVDFNGSLILYPGMCINVVSAITQSSDIILADWLWAEWLP
jgi:hypothetical protein